MAVAVALAATAGCAYFNTLYNADRLFSQGVKEIDAGRVAAGRANLGASIEKAERIAVSKPDSRWADDALRLIARGRLLREEWPEAARAAEQLLTYSTSARDSAEAFGYLGTARLSLGEPLIADSLLSIALAAEKQSRARAELLLARSRARAALGQFDAADTDLREATELRPEWLEPRIDRVRLLVNSGRGSEAVFWLASLFNMGLNRIEESQVVALADEVAAGSPETGIAALADVESSSLLSDDRADLVMLRAALQLQEGATEKAREDYGLAASLAPDSRVAVDAQVALISLDIQAVVRPGDLERPAVELERLSRWPAAAGSPALNRLRDALIRIDFWLETGNLGLVLAAETARDELDAPRLARSLFLEYADSQPQSLWAPKAILAALELSDLDSGDGADGSRAGPGASELRRRLLDDYAESAYVQVLVGGAGGRFTYEELEMGLRRQLERLQTLADQEVRARHMGSR